MKYQEWKSTLLQDSGRLRNKHADIAHVGNEKHGTFEAVDAANALAIRTDPALAHRKPEQKQEDRQHGHDRQVTAQDRSAEGMHRGNRRSDANHQERIEQV